MESANRGGDQIIPRPEIWRPGGPAPWAHLPPEDRQPTLADVRTAFATAPAAKPWIGPTGDGRKISAVLAALYARDEADGSEGLAQVLLTRRSQNMRAHRGEVSFPGGRSEPDDADSVATALREAREEVNLDTGGTGGTDGIEIIGELDHLATFSSGASIVPVVGVLPGPPTGLVAEPGEVDAILHVTLAELADPAHYREEIWRFPDGLDRSITFYELVGDTVWGATARMLRQLLALVLGVDAGPGPEAGSLTP